MRYQLRYDRYAAERIVRHQMPSLKREQARCMLAVKNASRGIQAGMDVEFKLDGNRTQKRHRGDSNPCGQSPMDFESISLATRTQCLEN